MSTSVIFSASDTLIDGAIITTDYDHAHQRFRTVRTTTQGVSREIHHWKNGVEARSGHSRTLRELTATISGTADGPARQQRH